MQLSAQFKLEKETKGTFRYAEETAGQPPKIGTLYGPEVGSPQASPRPHLHHSRSIGLTLAALGRFKYYGHS